MHPVPARIGLTGGIGMGKSTAANFFKRARIPVFDADACVHALQAPGGAALPGIEAAFPGVVKAGVLDRQELHARQSPLFPPDFSSRRTASMTMPFSAALSMS